MSKEDFGIESLAEYLHLTPDQVRKMADRSRLPGRKIGGEWRFSRPEIHHWLEERIGISNDVELTKVEDVLHRDEPREPPQFARLLRESAVEVPLNSRTRSSVISSMVDLAAATGLLWDPGKMEEAVRTRENLHPTALDNGVALLHPRRPMSSIVAEPFLALGRTYQPLPFGSRDGSLTDIFFLICSTDDRGHLSVLARLSRLLTDSDFVSSLRRAPDAPTSRQLVIDYGQQFEDS